MASTSSSGKTNPMNQALNLSIYRVSGEDATTFLQGQLTQDMTTTGQEWKYAAHCNPKGRVISLYQTFNIEGVHHLITPTKLAEEAIVQIKKYVMRSKVVIEESPLNAYFIDNHASSNQSFYQDDNNDIILSFLNSGSIKLSETIQDSNSQDDWDSARIQSGVPRIYPETLGVFTPEAINLDLSDAVSFTKGCYTGQEIVARMHYLGKAKQRLYHLSVESKGAIKPNSTITNASNEKIGVIVDIDSKGNALGSLKVNKLQQPLSIEGASIGETTITMVND